VHTRRIHAWAPALYITTLLPVAALLPANALLAQEPYAALAEAAQWEFLDKWCTECHNLDDYSGGLDMTSLGVGNVPADAGVWEKAIRKLNAGMMPPPGQPKPSGEESTEFVAWLESYLDEAGTKHPHITRPAIHRLNRKEYVNAVRDLLAVEIEPEQILPEDDTSEGFDNIADALQVSPAFIDQYVAAARVVMEMAIGDRTAAVGGTNYLPPETLPTRAEGGGSQQFHMEGMPLGTRGGMLVEHWFPTDGEYSVNIGDFTLHAWMYNIEFENRFILTVDGEKVYETILGGDADRIALDKDQGPPMDDINGRVKDIRFTTTAGPHKVAATFVRRTFAESDDNLQHFIPGALQDRILAIPSMEIRGPFNASGDIAMTPSRQKIFSCYPQDSSQEAACAEKIITEFATRAYRRDLTEEDMVPLQAFYAAGNEKGGFEEGIRQALTRALASPYFLYRAELVPVDVAPGSVYELSSLDLASRLSFFLWSSVPDEELLDLAFSGQLRQPEVLDAQVERMLADPKSSALASSFIYQWLDLDKLKEISPDPVLFPYAAQAGDLRPDFIKEIELFTDSVFRDDASILRLLDADYSFLNERLALHYGITDVKGLRYRRVPLADERRYGLLGKGAVLMVTAYPNRTSPVLRGAWVLERLIGSPPPAPPPNVEDLAENESGQPATTVRERLEKHRENPTCNACHAIMDPLGFALENFDATGRWRDVDRFAGTPIDASGVLPNGAAIDSPQDLRAALLERPDLFARSFTEKLLTYGLGLALSPYDMPTVRSIVREAAADDYRFSTLVKGIVRNPVFRMSVAPDAATAIAVPETASL
jgi:hypothetical protein